MVKNPVSMLILTLHIFLHIDSHRTSVNVLLFLLWKHTHVLLFSHCHLLNSFSPFTQVSSVASLLLCLPFYISFFLNNITIFKNQKLKHVRTLSKSIQFQNKTVSSHRDFLEMGCESDSVLVNTDFTQSIIFSQPSLLPCIA